MPLSTEAACELVRNPDVGDVVIAKALMDNRGWDALCVMQVCIDVYDGMDRPQTMVAVSRCLFANANETARTTPNFFIALLYMGLLGEALFLYTENIESWRMMDLVKSIPCGTNRAFYSFSDSELEKFMFRAFEMLDKTRQLVVHLIAFIRATRPHMYRGISTKLWQKGIQYVQIRVRYEDLCITDSLGFVLLGNVHTTRHLHESLEPVFGTNYVLFTKDASAPTSKNLLQSYVFNLDYNEDELPYIYVSIPALKENGEEFDEKPHSAFNEKLQNIGGLLDEISW